MAIFLYKRKTGITFLFLCSFFYGYTQKSTHFKVTAAAFQKTQSGIKGGGKGQEYYISLKCLKTATYKFDTAFVGDRALPVHFMMDNQKRGGTYQIKKKKPLVLRFGLFIMPNNTASLPQNEKIRVRYYLNDKIYFIDIQGLKEIEAEKRP